VKITLIGDSHMQALGPRLKTMLAEMAGPDKVRVFANPGWSLIRYLNEGQLAVKGSGAELIVFEVGGNNALTPEATDRARLTTAATLLRSQAAPGVRLILVGPAKAEDAAVDVRHAAATRNQLGLWEDTGYDEYIDSRPITQGQPLRDDEVHFEREGYNFWAHAILERIEHPASVEDARSSYNLVAGGIVVAAVAGLWFLRKRK
jgi:lysophospholipase L1-like esterase